VAGGKPGGGNGAGSVLGARRSRLDQPRLSDGDPAGFEVTIERPVPIEPRTMGQEQLERCPFGKGTSGFGYQMAQCIAEPQLAGSRQPRRGERGQGLGYRSEVEPRARGDGGLALFHAETPGDAYLARPPVARPDARPESHGEGHLFVDKELAGQLI